MSYIGREETRKAIGHEPMTECNLIALEKSEVTLRSILVFTIGGVEMRRTVKQGSEGIAAHVIEGGHYTHGNTVYLSLVKRLCY